MILKMFTCWLSDCHKIVLAINCGSVAFLGEDLIDYISHCAGVSIYQEIQKRNRLLWDSQLTRESYFCTIHDIIKP